VAGWRGDECAWQGWAAGVPDPLDRAPLVPSTRDWSKLRQARHRDMLAWYTELIALRRARPELTDPRLDRVRAEYDEQERWLVVRRGRVRIAANLGPSAQRPPPGGRGAAAPAASSARAAPRRGPVATP